jgi:hypothetical protein
MSEAPIKRPHVVTPSWLNLAQLGLYRDLRKLVYKKLEPFDWVMAEAAHLHKPVKLDNDFARCCARRGHLALLQWARENGCSPFNELVCVAAGEGGHLHVLQWLREQGCPWNKGTCNKAAGGGHFEVLKWAHENFCPWDSDTCAFAAKIGRLDILQWARERLCPWDHHVCTYAAVGGHL